MHRTPPTTKNPLQEVKNNSEKRLQIAGQGNISWKSKSRNIACLGTLLVNGLNQLRFELQDPLGGTLALLVIHDQEFWWYDAESKELLQGSVKRLSKILGWGLEATELARVFLARPEFLADPAMVIEKQDRVVQRHGDWLDEIIWSDRLWEPVQWNFSLANGDRAQVFFEDYSVQHGASVPLKIRIESLTLAGEPKSISWVWKDYVPRVGANPGFFKIPQDQNFGRKTKFLR